MSAIVFRVILYRVVTLDCSQSILDLPQRIVLNHGDVIGRVQEEVVNVVPAAIGSSHSSELNQMWIVLITLLLFFIFDLSSTSVSSLSSLEDGFAEFELPNEYNSKVVNPREVQEFLSDGAGISSQSFVPIEDIKLDDTWMFGTNELTVCSTIEDGVNGVYFVKLQDKEGNFGVFKPSHEEAFAPENQKDRIGGLNEESPLKSGTYVGEAYKKEVAAYLLDHEHFARVPATKFSSVRIQPTEAPKFGSLQEFVQNEGASEDFSPSKFSVKDVHSIGLLDTRICNLDRHSGNMLVVPNGGELSLIPIDHGFSLPDYGKLKDVTFDWLSWKQASVPFSEETKEYVKSLDVTADASMLKKLGLRDESIVTYLMCSTFTKEAVAAGWTLKMIGEFMQRDLMREQEPSKFEVLVESYVSKYSFDGISFQEGSLELLNFLETFKQIVLENVAH